MSINSKRAKEAFARYTTEYKDDDSRALLKIAHTYKVCDMSEHIAKSLGLSQDDVDIAWLVGLLHDVGRFEQLRRYGTFNDQTSADHAEIAVEVLFDNGEIRNYTTDESIYDLIKTSILMHNKYRVAKGLDERTKMFCDIIRDADKLDIFRVDTVHTKEEVFEVRTEDFNTTEITAEVLDSFFDERVVMKQTKKAAIDGLVCHLSLVYELVFPHSVKIAKESGYVNQLMNFVSENPRTNEQIAIMRNKLTEYMEKRIAENSTLDI